MKSWKTSTVLAALALGMAGGSFATHALADDGDSSLTTALDHLKAAKAAIKDAEVRHRRTHQVAIVATEVAIRAVEKEMRPSGPGPRDPGGPGPKDPGGPGPKDPGPTPKPPTGPTPKNP